MDVMYIDLSNVDIYAGSIENEVSLDSKDITNDCFKFGGCLLKKRSKSLLTKNCELKLQVERNLESSICHNGTLLYLSIRKYAIMITLFSA